MPERNRTTKTSQDTVELIAPWGLALLATLTSFGAMIRMFGSGEANVLKRIDNTTLLYLIVAGALLLFRSIKTFSFGDVKLEMLEKVRERQAQQEEKLDDLDLVIPLLLPKNEQNHLANLAKGQTNGYKGNGSLRNELRRLASSRLIARKPGKTIGDMRDGSTFNLADYVELTDFGRRWARRIEELERQHEIAQSSKGDTDKNA